MDLQLSGRRALVTGSRGLGRAVARGLLAEGVRVVIASRTAASVEAAAAELSAETGGEAHGLIVDTRDDASVDALVAATVETLGGLDIVVNTAARPGAAPPMPGVQGLPSSFLLDEIDAKVVGYLRVARAAAPVLIANGWGRIINIGGLAARDAVSITGTARSVAVAALTKNLADELGPKGINVTVVHPGPTRTEGTLEFIAGRAAAAGVAPEEVERRLSANSLLGRLVEPEEVADVITFLASPRSVAVNGDAVAVGGGVRGPVHY